MVAENMDTDVDVDVDAFVHVKRQVSWFLHAVQQKLQTLVVLEVPVLVNFDLDLSTVYSDQTCDWDVSFSQFNRILFVFTNQEMHSLMGVQ